MGIYANVIVDISLEKLDKTFQYRIPEELKDKLQEGMQVQIPFGPRTITGYVVEISDTPEFDVSKIKPLIGIVEGSIAIESRLIELAGWLRRNYGSTMNQALKTVLPVKQETKPKEKRCLVLAVERARAMEHLALFEEKNHRAKARLLREILAQGELDYSVVTQKLHVAASVVKGMEEAGIIAIKSERTYRNPVEHYRSDGHEIVLNDAQQAVVDEVLSDRARGIFATYLLKGVTGSGKTEVYMELIARVIAEGRQAIVLIPEIALTYQTVMRFYKRFGDRVSILNSKMSPGERYDQYLRAKNGDIDIMIGPRSALFTPFPNIGLIIIDEEHESSYKSETAPRYHARETAVFRASQTGASVLLGSATPSMESYYRAKRGIYKLLTLDRRVENRPLPECEMIDMRSELREGNRSILSTRLQELMEERLRKGQQIMLFLNRRGVAGFMSCRACGHVVKCPHCDVSLSQHNNGKMVCHYCGYEEQIPKVCPSCGSKYISGFKAGTQKIEMLVKQRFPEAKILRMDFDTTRTKDSYEKILQAFGNHEADILIGTQMIVKGHDFANVTLVGILAADMVLHVSDYHAPERTFQLLTQAAGRAGRGSCPGNVVIQSYDTEHYALKYAMAQDYDGFYEQEISYREIMNYPPVWNMLVLLCTAAEQELLEEQVELIMNQINEKIHTLSKTASIHVVGPADASVSKINDIFRKVIYLKTSDYESLIAVKDYVEGFLQSEQCSKELSVQFDFNPMSGF